MIEIVFSLCIRKEKYLKAVNLINLCFVGLYDKILQRAIFHMNENSCAFDNFYNF